MVHNEGLSRMSALKDLIPQILLARRRQDRPKRLFFFQAADGIRDKLVTGVQTCALPILPHGSTEVRSRSSHPALGVGIRKWPRGKGPPPHCSAITATRPAETVPVNGAPESSSVPRSEERRVGKGSSVRRSDGWCYEKSRR